MTKVRDIAAFLGKTEAFNTTNKRLAFDSNQISTLTPTIATDIIGQYGVVVYNTVDSLPASPNDGDRAWVTGNNRFYIADSSWHNALLVNTPPTINILNYDSALNDSSSLTMTIQVTDSFENLDIISFGATISPSNITDSAVLTFSRDSSVIALAISDDSANEATSFTITFSANDQVNLATSVKSFTIDKGFILTATDVYVSSTLSSTATRVYVDSDVTDIFQDDDVINDNNGNDATVTNITMENLTYRGTESTSFTSTSSIIYSDADLSSTVSTGQIMAASNVVTSGNLGRDEAGYTRYGEVTGVTYSAGGPSSSAQVTNAATYLGAIKCPGSSSYPYVVGYAFSYSGTYFVTNGSTAQYYHLDPSTNTINTSYMWPSTAGYGTIYLVGTYSYLASGFENIGSGAFNARWYSGAISAQSTHYKRNTQTIGGTPGTTYNLTLQGNQTTYYTNGSAIDFSQATYNTTGGMWFVVSNPSYNSGTNTTTVPLQTYTVQTLSWTNGAQVRVRKNTGTVPSHTGPNYIYYMFIPMNTSVDWSKTVNAGITAGSSFRPYNVYGYTAANTAISYTHAGTSPGSGTLISNGGQIYTGNPTTRLTVDAGGTQFTSGERIYLKT
jgi:hypothetical protein